MDIITIDGVPLPHPSSLKIGRSDLDSPDTTRNEEGFLQRDRVRQGVYKIELSFKAKTSSEIATLESAVQGASLNVTFPTPQGRQTKTMYAGDRSIDVVLYNGGGDKTRWDMSFNLIEY